MPGSFGIFYGAKFDKYGTKNKNIVVPYVFLLDSVSVSDPKTIRTNAWCSSSKKIELCETETERMSIALVAVFGEQFMMCSHLA